MHDHDVGVLVYPTATEEAAPLGEEQGHFNCKLAAASGLPAISVPAGFGANGLPVAIEFLAAAWAEQKLLNLAATVEQLVPVAEAAAGHSGALLKRVPTCAVTPSVTNPATLGIIGLDGGTAEPALTAPRPRTRDYSAVRGKLVRRDSRVADVAIVRSQGGPGPQRLAPACSGGRAHHTPER